MNSTVTVKSSNHVKLYSRRAACSPSSGNALGVLIVCTQIRYEAQTAFWSHCALDLTGLYLSSSDRFNEVFIHRGAEFAKKIQVLIIYVEMADSLSLRVPEEADMKNCGMRNFVSVRRVVVGPAVLIKCTDRESLPSSEGIRRCFGKENLEVDLEGALEEHSENESKRYW
jgi:hypothetical protein